MQKESKQISVYGMKCQKCVARVTGLIEAFPAVTAVSVSLEEKCATIGFSDNPDEVSPKIEAALHEAGFATRKTEQADEKSSSAETAGNRSKQDLQQVRFGIKGMSCASCAATIEKRLREVRGIDSISVNLAGNFGQAVFNRNLLREEDIFAAVAAAGFEASAEQQSSTDQDTRRETINLLIAAAGAIPIMVLMFFPLFGSATLYVNAVLASIVQFTAGLGFYQSAWKSLKNRSANMDVLVSLGITAAYGYSVLAVSGLLGPDATVFFETSAMLILFIRFGKWLEARAKGKAGAALKQLLKLQADRAVILVAGQEQEISASEVKPGDLLLVKAGEKLPVDGEVVEGAAAVDESMISGESIPVSKEPGSVVTGATINCTGRLVIRATRVGEDTVLAQIVRMVEDAQGDKAPIQRIADRVSNYFVPAVVLFALLTFATWFLLVGDTFLFAFQMAIAVLVIACPCALGLATPTAIMVGSSVGLERGILFKKASVLEQISKLQVLLLDKTGTLTSGQFKVDEILGYAELDETELLQLAAAIESGSNHPLAKSIVEEASQRNLQWKPASQLKEIGGQGLKAEIDGKHYLCGQQSLLQQHGVALSAINADVQRLTASGKSLVCLSRDQQVVGVIALSDTLKPRAKDVVTHLQGLGIECVLLTGDRRVSAETVAEQIGIEQVEAEVVPEQKLDVVKKYQRQGQMVGMVGDGINDAPALAQADIGIAIGSGTDVAKETGDLVLVGSDLFDIARGIRLGRQTLCKIKQNLFWAFFYNVLGIPLAAGLFYPLWGLYLKPEFAGLAMAFSSVSVVTNSLLLRRMKNKLGEV